MDGFDLRVFHAGGQIIKLFPKPNFAHYIETEEHGPLGSIDCLPSVFLDVQDQKICLGSDTLLVCR
jgi:hypothetical protein